MSNISVLICCVHVISTTSTFSRCFDPGGTWEKRGLKPQTSLHSLNSTPQIISYCEYRKKIETPSRREEMLPMPRGSSCQEGTSLACLIILDPEHSRGARILDIGKENVDQRHLVSPTTPSAPAESDNPEFNNQLGNCHGFQLFRSSAPSTEGPLGAPALKRPANSYQAD